MKHDGEFDRLEEALRRAGRGIAYPATPRLAARVRAHLESGRAPIFGLRRFGLLPGLAAAAVTLLLVLAGVFAYVQQQTAKPQRPFGTAYTANLWSGDLSVVDLFSGDVHGSIEVGASPWGIAITKDGRRIFVAVDGGVAIVDTARRQRIDFVATPGYTRAKVALSADERTLLVAHGGGRMALIDLPSRGILNEFAIEILPYDIKVAPHNRWAYVLSQKDGSLAVVDLRSGEITGQLLSGLGVPGYFMALSPDGRSLYVPKLGRNEIWIIDTETNAVRSVRATQKPFPLPDPDRGVVVSADGSRLYIAIEYSPAGSVLLLDARDFSEIARTDIGRGPFGVALSPDGLQVLVTDPQTNSVHILAADTLKFMKTVQVGQSPYRVVVGP